MADALQLEEQIKELELISQYSRKLSISFSRNAPRILIAMTVYFVMELRCALLESADVTIQKCVTMDLPAQLASVTKLLVCASINPNALNQDKLAYVLNLQGNVN